MGLLTIDDQQAVTPDAIVSDPLPFNQRKSMWRGQLEKLAEKCMNGEVAAGGYLELARFKAASGAATKLRSLCELQRKGELPGAGGGEYAFKTQVYAGVDGARHSSLYGTFSPRADSDEAADS